MPSPPYHLHWEIADVTMIHLGVASSGGAHVFLSWLHPSKEQKLALVGSDAMALFDDSGPWGFKLRCTSHKVSWKNNTPMPNKADSVPVAVEETEPFKQECQHFLDRAPMAARAWACCACLLRQPRHCVTSARKAGVRRQLQAQPQRERVVRPPAPLSPAGIPALIPA
jgi:hypothetical protein